MSGGARASTRASSFRSFMVDCAATHDCLVPMWGQYGILLLALIPFLVKSFSKPDPLDRR